MTTNSSSINDRLGDGGLENVAVAVTGPNGEVSLQAGGVHLGGTPRQCLLVDSLGTPVPGGIYTKVSMDKAVIDTDSAAVLANKSIKVPSWANFVKVTAHLSFPDQNAAPGHASVHLWRKSDPTKYTAAGLALIAAGYDFQLGGSNLDSPTPEAHYHNRVYYPQLATSYYISVLAVTGWLPVIATGEEWTAYAWQDSGSNVTLPNTGGVESWLLVEFK